MKQLILVLAVALILIAIPLGNTEARLHPDGFRALDKDNGEDHPWGGESDWQAEPDPISSPVKDVQVFSTGYSPFDYYMWSLIINVWTINEPKTDVIVSDDIPGGTTNEENEQSETITSRN